jgi:hypothetical protein
LFGLSPLRLPFRHARIAGSLVAVGSVFRLFFISPIPLVFSAVSMNMEPCQLRLLSRADLYFATHDGV